MNWGILLPVLGLALIGIISIWSVTPAPDVSVFGGGYSIKDKIVILLAWSPVKQVLFALLGFLLMAGLVSVPYYKLKDYAYILYFTMLFLLIALIVLGRVTQGVKRWIPLGPFAFQPAEFMKLVLVLLLAALLMYHKRVLPWRYIIAAGAVALCPVGLVMLQPNLGTALVFLPTLLAMLVVARLRVRDLVLIAMFLLIVLPLGYFGIMKDYQKKRIQTFISPTGAATAEGFQAVQAKTAVGSGGIFGRGWGRSETTTSLFVPAKHNDFIFTTIAEEWGFLGSSLVIILYLVFFISALLIAYHTRESFGRLLTVGLVTYLASQTLINLGMTIGLAPIAGITLPFVSYGGSSLVSSFIAAGLIINVGLKPIHTFEAEEA